MRLVACVVSIAGNRHAERMQTLATIAVLSRPIRAALWFVATETILAGGQILEAVLIDAQIVKCLGTI